MKPLQYLLINTNVLAAVTIMYTYWLMGGKNSLEYFFPAKTSLHRQKIKPNRWRLLLIVIVLLFMTWMSVEQIETFLIETDYNALIFLWANRFIGAFFLLRAIGNFTYVGFSKTFRKSTYAKLDTYLYSPICLIIVINCYMLEHLAKAAG